MTAASSRPDPDRDPERPPRAPRPIRRDSALTYARLIEATGRLLEHDPHRAFNLTRVADEAGVSTATAYRYFRSTDELVDAYLDDFVAELGRRRARRSPTERAGVAGLRTLAQDYVELVLARGRAMVHGRSLAGILQRHRRGDADIERIWVVYREPIAGALDELGLPDSELEFAILLWNAIFYAREVLDLHDALGWSADEIARRLTVAYVAALAAGRAELNPPP